MSKLGLLPVASRIDACEVWDSYLPYTTLRWPTSIASTTRSSSRNSQSTR